MSDRFSSLFTDDLKITLKKFILITLLISSSLAWFFLINIYFFQIFDSLAVSSFWADVDLMLFYGLGAFSALIGSSVSKKMGRRNLLSLWTIMGVSASLSILVFQGVIFSLILSGLLGFSVGFGFPSIAAFLADSTESEERGRVSGLIILITFILTFMGIAIIPLLGTGIIGIVAFCVLLRCSGFIPLIFDKCERKLPKIDSWRSVIKNNNFALYLFPWILFNLAAGLLDWSSASLSKSPDIETARNLGVEIGYVFTAFSGVIAGLLADRFGRKQPIVIALVLIGISFALLGFAQIPQTILIYYSVYGIAWGFLFAIYLTVPGDVSSTLSKEKFYALGTIVPLTIFTSSSSILNFLEIQGISTGLLSPILSAIIFLSIIPVLRANETLPSSKINARKIKEHLNKVGKLIKESKEQTT